MKAVAADQKALDEYGLPELPFVIPDPENTRYVTETAQFTYIKEGDDTVGFVVFLEEEEQIIIYYIAFDEDVSLSSAEKFMKEFCGQKEVFAVTYDKNIASQLFDAMGFYQEPGLQYMELSHIPDFGSSYGLEYVLISPTKIPAEMTDLYNQCFAATDGEETLEEFILDTFSRTGTDLILQREGENIGFWVDVTYFGDMCFNCWIGIVPEHRRKGYATQLMEYALNRAREKGHTKAGLLVNPSNVAAVEFYKLMGFQRKWGRIHFQSESE